MALSESLERDGFQVRKKVFINPLNAKLFDSVTERKITICNLFANDGVPVGDIVRVLNEKYDHVVKVLIEQGLIRERRKQSSKPVQVEHRT